MSDLLQLIASEGPTEVYMKLLKQLIDRLVNHVPETQAERKQREQREERERIAKGVPAHPNEPLRFAR